MSEHLTDSGSLSRAELYLKRLQENPTVEDLQGLERELTMFRVYTGQMNFPLLMSPIERAMGVVMRRVKECADTKVVHPTYKVAENPQAAEFEGFGGLAWTAVLFAAMITLFAL